MVTVLLISLAQNARGDLLNKLVSSSAVLEISIQDARRQLTPYEVCAYRD